MSSTGPGTCSSALGSGSPGQTPWYIASGNNAIPETPAKISDSPCVCPMLPTGPIAGGASAFYMENTMQFKLSGATFETGRPQSLSPNATALEPGCPGSRSTWREPCCRRHVHLSAHKAPPPLKDIEIALSDEDSCRCCRCSHSVGLGPVSSPLSIIQFITTSYTTAWNRLQ